MMGTVSETAVDSPPRSDRVIAVVLLVALGLLSPIVSFLALMFSMVSDGCGAGASCDADQIGNGVALAGLAPWAGLVGAIVVVVKRVRRGQRVWWVPLVAAAIAAGLFIAGGLLAATAVG